MAQITTTTAALLVATLLFVQPAVASFSLNTVVQDYWYYVGNHLASTTSAACEAAYAAPIDCDQTLLGFVSSGDPGFNPGPDEYESLCVDSCSESLASWVSGVEAACDVDDGDAALVESSTGSSYRPEVPVSVIGEIFQYQFASSCLRNASGWCSMNYGIWPNTMFSCDDSCAVQLFATAHDYPGSAYRFLIYDLINQSSWWKTEYDLGWDRIVECRSQGTTPPSDPNPTPTYSSTPVSSSYLDLSTTTSTTTSTETPSSSLSGSSAPSTSSSSSVSLEASTPSPNPTPNAAGKVGLPLMFLGRGGWI